MRRAIPFLPRINDEIFFSDVVKVQMLNRKWVMTLHHASFNDTSEKMEAIHSNILTINIGVAMNISTSGGKNMGRLEDRIGQTQQRCQILHLWKREGIIMKSENLACLEDHKWKHNGTNFGLIIEKNA